MSQSAHILQASFHDIEDVITLFDQYRMFYGQSSDKQGAASFIFQLMERRESVILLAREEERGDALGFAQVYPSYSSISMRRTWILNDLFVVKESRGRGIGRERMTSDEENRYCVCIHRE